MATQTANFYQRRGVKTFFIIIEQKPFKVTVPLYDGKVSCLQFKVYDAGNSEDPQSVLQSVRSGLISKTNSQYHCKVILYKTSPHNPEAYLCVDGLMPFGFGVTQEFQRLQDLIPNEPKNKWLIKSLHRICKKAWASTGG